MSGMWSSLFGRGSRSPSPNARGRGRRRSSSIDEGSPGVQWGGDRRASLGKLSPRDWQLVQEMSLRRSRKLCTRAIICWSWSLQCRRRACAILEAVADWSVTGDAFAAWREMVLGGGSVLHGEEDYDEMLRPASSSGSQVRGILRRTQLSSREGEARGGWNGEDDEEPGLHVDVREMASEAQQMMIEILMRRVEDAGFERMSYSLAEYFLSRSRGQLEDAVRMVARHATASDVYYENLAARSFNTWNIKMMRKAVIRAGMEAMLIIRVTNTQKECVESWRLATQRQGLERNAREMHLIRLVGSVLRSWRKKARILGLARGMSALIRARAALHLYNKAYGGWFDETSSANFLREVGAHIKWVSWKRLLKESFECWKDLSNWKLALERMSRSVALDYMRKLTLSALVGWSMVSLSKIALKNIWHYFDEAFGVGTRRDVIRSWHSTMLLQRLGRQYLDEWHHDIKLEVLTGWLKRAQSVKTFVFFASRERRLQQLLAWRVAAQTSVWHRLILGKVQFAALVRGFREWNEISRYVRYLRSHCMVASSGRMMKSVHRIVLRWFAFARYSRRCAEILKDRTTLVCVKYQTLFLKAWFEWAENRRFLSKAGKDLSVISTKRLQALVLKRMRIFGSNSLFLKGVEERGANRFRDIALCEWRNMHKEYRSLLFFVSTRADARAHGVQRWVLREWRGMSDDLNKLKRIASAVKIAQAKRVCGFFMWTVKLLVSHKKVMAVSQNRLAKRRHMLASTDAICKWRNASSLRAIRRNVDLKVHRMCFTRVMDALRWRVSLANLKQRAEDMALDSVVKTFFALFAGQVKVECTLHGFWKMAQRRILWKHLSAWVDAKESARLVVHVVTRIASRVKAVYYCQWVKLALSWGRGIAAFEERRTTLCLEDAFAEWQFVAMCQANINDKGKWLEDSSRKNFMSRALNDWRGAVDFKFERQDMLTAMNDLREQELLEIAFREMLISVGEQIWYKDCHEEISAKHSVAVCRTVWAAWLYGVEVQENANELLDKVLRRLGTNLVDEWMKVAVTYRGHIRSTREKLNKSTLRLVFGSWRDYGARQDSLWGAVEATVAGSMARSKGIAFASWRDHCKSKANMWVTLRRAVQTFAARRKRFAFVVWQRRMAASVNLQAAYVTIRNAQRKIRASRAVKGWKYVAIELHVKLMTHEEKRRPQRLAPVFRAWSIAIKHAAYLRSPKGKSMITSSFQEWARVSVSWRRLVERGRRNGGKIARRLAVCAWKHECVTIPSTIASFAEKHRHAGRMKKRICAAWCKLVYVHLKFMRPLEDRKRKELLQDFLFMWRFVAEAQSNLARAGQVLEEQTMEDLTAFAFFEWSTLTSHRMEIRLLIQRVSNLRETEILENCFSALAEHAAFQKFLADTEDKIAGPRESGFLLRAFREWMRLVTAKRSKERLIKAFRNKTIQRERAQKAVGLARRTSVASIDSQGSPHSPRSPIRSPKRLSPSSSFRNLDLMGLERPRLNSTGSFQDLNLALQSQLQSTLSRTPSFARTSSFQRASSFTRTSSLGMGVRSTVVTRLLVRSDAGLKQQTLLCWLSVVQRRQFLAKFEISVNERFLRSFFFVWVLVGIIQPRKIAINLGRMDRRIKCGAFDGWKLVSVTYGARLRSFGERHQVRKRLICIHFTSWALLVSITRRVHFIMEDNLMSKVFKEWSRVTVVRRAQIAMGRRLIRSNLLGHALRAWKWVAITLKWKVIDHQERHWPLHVAPMFQAWRILARFDKNFRGASDKISARRSFYEWARVSVSWRRLVERGRRNGDKIACKLVLSAWKHECVTIPEWIRLFEESHRHNFGHQRRAMDAWIICVFLYAASLKKYAEKIRKASLVFALSAWREETNEMSHLARAGAAVTEISLDNLAMVVLFEWATYTLWKRETLLLIQRVSNLRETEILENCFSALAEHAAFQKFLADTEDKIAGPRESGFLLRAFREWMRLVTAKRSKERLIKAFRNKTIQRERAQKAVGLARLSSNASHHSSDVNSPHSPRSPIRSPKRLSPSSSFRNLDLMGLERPRLNSTGSFKDLNLALQNRLQSSAVMQRTPSFARTSSFQRASSFTRTSSLGMGVRSTVVTRLLVRSDAGLKQQAFLCWQAVITRIQLVAGFESKVLDHLLSNIFAEWVHHRSVSILVGRGLERTRAVCLQQWSFVTVVYNRRIDSFQRAHRYWERCIGSALTGWRIFVRFSVYFSGPRDETLVRSSFRFWASKVENVRALKQGRSSAEFSRTASAFTRTQSSLHYSSSSRTPSAYSSSIPSPRMSSDRPPRFVAPLRHVQHVPPRSASTSEDQQRSMPFLSGPEPHFSRSATSSSPMSGALSDRPPASIPQLSPQSPQSTFGVVLGPVTLPPPPSSPGLAPPGQSRKSKIQSSTGTPPASTGVPSPTVASPVHPVVHMLKSDFSPRRLPDAISRSFSVDNHKRISDPGMSGSPRGLGLRTESANVEGNESNLAGSRKIPDSPRSIGWSRTASSFSQTASSDAPAGNERMKFAAELIGKALSRTGSANNDMGVAVGEITRVSSSVFQAPITDPQHRAPPIRTIGPSDEFSTGDRPDSPRLVFSETNLRSPAVDLHAIVDSSLNFNPGHGKGASTLARTGSKELLSELAGRTPSGFLRLDSGGTFDRKGSGGISRDSPRFRSLTKTTGSPSAQRFAVGSGSSGGAALKKVDTPLLEEFVLNPSTAPSPALDKEMHKKSRSLGDYIEMAKYLLTPERTGSSSFDEKTMSSTARESVVDPALSKGCAKAAEHQGLDAEMESVLDRAGDAEARAAAKLRAKAVSPDTTSSQGSDDNTHILLPVRPAAGPSSSTSTPYVGVEKVEEVQSQPVTQHAQDQNVAQHQNQHQQHQHQQQHQQQHQHQHQHQQQQKKEREAGSARETRALAMEHRVSKRLVRQFLAALHGITRRNGACRASELIVAARRGVCICSSVFLSWKYYAIERISEKCKSIELYAWGEIRDVRGMLRLHSGDVKDCLSSLQQASLEQLRESLASLACGIGAADVNDSLDDSVELGISEEMALRLLHDNEGDVSKATAVAAEAFSALHATRHRAARVTKNTVLGWRMVTRWERTLQALSSKLQIVAIRRFVVSFVGAWREFVACAAGLRALGLMAREHLWVSFGRRFMSHWRAGIAFLHKGTLARVMGANERFKRLVKALFVAWTDLIHWRASLRFVSIYMSNMTRAKRQVEYFQAWVEVVEYREIQRSVRQGSNALAACSQLGLLSDVLRDWHCYARASTLARLGRVMARRHLMQVIRSCIDAWWGVLEKRKEKYIASRINADELMQPDFARSCLESARGDERVASYQARWLLHADKVALIASALETLSPEYQAKCLAVLSLVSDPSAMLHGTAPPAGPQLGGVGAGAGSAAATLGGVVWVTVPQAVSWIMLHVHNSEESLSRFYAAWLEVASQSLRMRKWKKACLCTRLRPWFDAVAYSVIVSVRAEGLSAKVQVGSLVRTMKAWHEEATNICQVVYGKANDMSALKSSFLLSEVFKAWGDACTVYISLRLVSMHMWKIMGQIHSSWFFERAMKLWGQYTRSKAMGRCVRCRPAMRKWLDAMVLKRLCERVDVHLTRFSAMKRIRRWRANVERIQKFKGVGTNCLKHAAAAHFREWRSECRLSQFAKDSGLRLVGKRLLAWGRVRPRRVECEALAEGERAKGATRTLRDVIECWSDFRHSKALVQKVVRSAAHSQLSDVVQAWSDRAMIHRMVGFRSALHSTGALHATFLCWARLVRREWNITLRSIRTRGRLVLRAFHCWYEGIVRIKEQREALRASEARFAARVCREWRARGVHKKRVRQLADGSKILHKAVCVWAAFDQMRARADEPEDAKGRVVKAMSRRLARCYNHNRAETAFGGMSRYGRRRVVLREAEAAWKRQDLTVVWLEEFVRLWMQAIAYCETKRSAQQLGRLAELRRGLHSWSWCTGRIKELRDAGSRGAELQERLSSKWRISVCRWCVRVFRWYASFQWRKYLASIQRKSGTRKMFYSWREGASFLALKRSLTATYRTDILEIAWHGMAQNAARKHMLITCTIMDQQRSQRFGLEAMKEAVVLAQEQGESAAAITHMVGGSLVLWAVQCWKSIVDEEWAVKDKELAARVCIEVSLLECRELLRASRGSVDDAASTVEKGLIKVVMTSAGIDSTSNMAPDTILATIEQCEGDIDEAIYQVSEQAMMRVAANFCSSTILAAFTSEWRGRARRDAALRDAVSAFSAQIAVARAQRLVKDAAEWLFAHASMKIVSKRHSLSRVAKAIPNILSGWLAASRRVKGQRERGQRVESAMGGHLVRRAWRVWDEFILDRPMKSALLLDVNVLRRKVVGGFLRDVVVCWKRFTGRNFKSYLGSVMLRMSRIRLAFEGWDLASERRWEGDRKHKAALKAHLASFLEAWHRNCMMRTAVKVYFQPGFRNRFLGFWLSGWARETLLMRRVKRIVRRKADREQGEAAGGSFDHWSLSWAMERGGKMDEVEAMMTSSRGIKIVQAQPEGILKRFRGDLDAVRAAIVNPQAQALRKLTGSKISVEKAVALLSESGGVFTDAEQAAVLEVKGEKAAAFRRGLLLRAWQAYVDGKVVVAVSGARASILLRRGLLRRVFEAARDFAYGRISRRAVAERMGWGAELGIGARKRTAKSWFIARWKYHASVGASAKRFQEKRAIRAGRNAAIEWRLVADQRPVRDAVRRLIVAKQRKRDANFCRDVWGEWRHRVWLSFRVYLGKISARASLVKFSFGAWYTLWCRQVYGPRCMRDAIERLSIYRVLGVWMDEVEEECAWKEEELSKRMLTEDGGMLNMSATSAGMTKSGAIFAVPHTRSGKSASPSRRGSSARSSLSQDDASNFLMKDIEASRHLEGQKWTAGAGAEEGSIAGGASRVDGEADATIGGAGDLSGVDASMMMLQLSELDVSGDAHGHATDILNISHSVIESTPTDILRASRNSIHDAFRMLDSLQAKALQESVYGPLPTDTALWVLHEAGLFPDAVGMAHDASCHIIAGEHRLRTIFRELSIASAQRRARGLVGARVAALHAMALVRGGLRSWEGVVWWKKDSARRSVVFGETWRPCREREFFRAWAEVSEEGAWRESVRKGVLRGAGSWAWWELGRYARRRAGMRRGQRAVVEGVNAKTEVVKLELQIRREYSALEAQMLLRGKGSLTCNEACPLIGTMIGEADWHVEEANSHFEEAVSFLEQSLAIDERGDGEASGDGDRQQQLEREVVSAQVSKDESFHDAFSTFLDRSDDGNRSTSPLGSTAVVKVSPQGREPSALQTAAAMHHVGGLVTRALASLTLARALNAWEHQLGSEKRLAKLGFELGSAHISLEMQRVFARWYGVFVYRQSLVNAEQSSQVWSANLSMRCAFRGWRGVSQRVLHLVKAEDTIGRRRLGALMDAWVSEAAFSKVCKSARITAGRRCLSAALEWWVHALEVGSRIRGAEHTWRGGYQRYWLRVAATSLACWKGVSGARSIKVRHAEMTAGGIIAAWGGLAGRKRWFAEIVAGSRQIIEERLLRRVVSSWFDHSSRHLVSWVVVRGGELLRTRTLVMAWRGYVAQKKWRAEVIAGGAAARNAGLVEEAWLTWWVASFKMRHVVHIPGNGEGDDEAQRTEDEEDLQDDNEAEEEEEDEFFSE